MTPTDEDNPQKEIAKRREEAMRRLQDSLPKPPKKTFGKAMKQGPKKGMNFRHQGR